MKAFDGYGEKRSSERQELIRSIEDQERCPASWADGPVRNPFRRVTDKCCLIVFLLYLIGMLVTGFYILTNTKAHALKTVYDSSGNICGEGAAQKFPFLYLQTFQQPYKSVCVSSCPVFDYNRIKEDPLGKDFTNLREPMFFFEFTKFAGKTFVKGLDFTRDEIFAYDKSWANNYFTKDNFDKYVNKIETKCYPNKQYSECYKNDPAKDFYIYDSYPIAEKFCAPVSPKPALLFNELNSKILTGDFGDIKQALPILGWCALIAIGLSFVFLILLTCCTS